MENLTHGICHLDADCFYASVETIYAPEKLGKPFAVVSHVGGIVLSSSYEARKFKVKVGTPTWEAETLCPGITFESANFPRYVKHSLQMMEMLRTFTPDVEEYSIDEAFFDLTSVQEYFKCSYEEIARNIQKKIWNELHLPVSIGVSFNKTLAKLASDFHKPKGITVVTEENRNDFLSQCKLDDVAGIGYHNTQRLLGNGITTLHEFIAEQTSHIKKILGINGVRLQLELRGGQAISLETQKNKPKSISRSRTFRQITKDFDFLLAELMLHLQEVAMRLRSHHLSAKHLSIFIRKQEEYRYASETIALEDYSDDTMMFAIHIEPLLKKIFKPKTTYRASGVVLSDFVETLSVTKNLFSSKQELKGQHLGEAIDTINKKFGKRSLVVGSSVLLHQQEEERVEQKEAEISYRGRFISL
ncbi:MAG: DNA polymerase IV [Ignavibacteria bacterium]|nr:DNA polymerase IV [Ignavibacteria bacterium]